MSQNEFTPTHIAPREGLQAWDAPDPSRPAIAQVQPGVRMQLMERRGAWARVLFSNGWSGWVDGRRMVDAVPRPAPPPSVPVREQRDPAQYAPQQPAYRPESQPQGDYRPETSFRPRAEPLQPQQPTSRPDFRLEPQLRPEQPRPEQLRPQQPRPEQPRPDQLRPEQLRPEQPAYRGEPRVEPPFRPEPEPRVEPAFRPEEPQRPAFRAEPEPEPQPQPQQQSAFRPEPEPEPESAFRPEPEPTFGRDHDFRSEADGGYRAGTETLGDERYLAEPDATAPVDRPVPSAPARPANLLEYLKAGPAAIGVIAVLIGSLLPWIRMSGFRGNAFRVPLTFLVDYKTTGGFLKVGLAVLALAVAAGVFCVLPGQVRTRRILGGIIGVIAAVYVIQLQRVLSAAGSGAPSLTSVVGFGVLIVLAGSVALLVDTNEPPPR